MQKERQTGAIREKDEQIDGLEKTIEDLQRRIKMLETDLESAEEENETKTKYVIPVYTSPGCKINTI